MIAPVRAPHERRRSAILDASGNPYVHPQRFDMTALMQHKLARQNAQFALKYDAAQDTDPMRRYWAYADSLDADSANSKGVRDKLRSRSRYEAESNPIYAGILSTNTNYLVGTGPRLRMQTNNAGFNSTIESLFRQWWVESQMGAKLWAMAHAKTQDGEALALLVNNRSFGTRVQLDVLPIESEQCQTPGLWGGESDYIDGIKLDEFGNPLWYDILKQHPGGGPSLSMEAMQVPASQVLHWFRMRRPGQHRGVPEMTSSLSCGAAFRRWRDSTLKAADRAATFSVLLNTNMAPDDGDLMTPFTTAEIENDTLMALPWQYDAKQLEAKHPNANFDVFYKAQVSEQARPLGMPYNVAACDSSSYNYASGRLDHQTYFMSLDVERSDCEARLLDKLFRAWWEEAVLVYEFAVESLPAHTWDWPQHPVADVRAEAIANNFKLHNGSATLTQVYADAGYDASEQMQAEADLLGVPIAEYKRRVFDALYPPTPATQASPQEASDQADREELQNQIEERLSYA